MTAASIRVCILLVVSVLVSVGSASAKIPLTSSLSGRIDAVADELIATVPLAGLSIAVEKDGRIVHAEGYGFADVEAGRRAEADTVYRIGSIGKEITAAVVLRLAEQGALGLDDPILRYLPDHPDHWEDITIRHLLSHTSGIPELTTQPVFSRSQGIGMSLEEAIALFSTKPLDFRPGSEWRYSNSGYLLLGRVIERVTRKPFGRVATERVLERLGASSLSYCPEGHRDAEGYEIRNGSWQRALRLGRPPGFTHARPVNMSIVSSAGAFCGSVVDLLRWASALREGKIVEPDSYEEMTAPAILTNGRRAGYGLGVMLRSFNDHSSVAHGGLINGFTTLLAHFPADDVAIAIATNTTLPDTEPYYDLITSAVLGEPAQPGWSPIQTGGDSAT